MSQTQVFHKVFRETDCIVIPATEHQFRYLSIDYCLKVYALKADGTPDVQVPLAYTVPNVELAAEGLKLTVQLPTRCSGVVCLWPPAERPPLDR